MTSPSDHHLSKGELDLYDRQIRLYGLSAQEKIRKGVVFIFGAWSLAMQELLKNLVLNGIGHIKLVIDGHKPESSYAIFGMQMSIKEYFQGLNNTVKLELLQGETDLRISATEAQQVVFLHDDLGLSKEVAQHYREHSIPFSCVFGNAENVYFVNDLPSHQFQHFTKDQQGSRMAHTETLSTIPFSEALSLTQMKERDGCISQVDPCCSAIIGAVAAQEVIKVITRENRPIAKPFLVNAKTIEGRFL